MNKKVLNFILFSAALILGYKSYKLVKDKSEKKCKFEVIEDNDKIISFDENNLERKYITLRKAN